MIRITCDECSRPMNSIEGIHDHGGTHTQVFECDTCHILLEVKTRIKIHEIMAKAISRERPARSVVDPVPKDCKPCGFAHTGFCEDQDDDKGDFECICNGIRNFNCPTHGGILRLCFDSESDSIIDENGECYDINKIGNRPVNWKDVDTYKIDDKEPDKYCDCGINVKVHAYDCSGNDDCGEHEAVCNIKHMTHDDEIDCDNVTDLPCICGNIHEGDDDKCDELECDCNACKFCGYKHTGVCKDFDDEDFKHPICPYCAERHNGTCEKEVQSWDKCNENCAIDCRVNHRESHYPIALKYVGKSINDPNCPTHEIKEEDTAWIKKDCNIKHVTHDDEMECELECICKVLQNPDCPRHGVDVKDDDKPCDDDCCADDKRCIPETTPFKQHVYEEPVKCEEVKCAAPVSKPTLSELGNKVRRLELEKQILDLERDIHYAEEGKRERG